MSNWYVLEGRSYRAARNMNDYAEGMDRNRRVARDELGDCRVSTVFLGLDHGDGDGPPLVFETMVFGGPFDQWCDRCSTYDEAEAQHARAVAFCREGVAP